jgi:predicted alpha/beta-fold hydrolase
MALIARTLSKSGFRVITYDAPAHTSIVKNSSTELSNFFEFSRALALVSKNMGPFHAIAGHSLGAIASVFAITGKSLPAGNRIHTEKLILMGLPVYLENLVTSFCKNHGLNENDCLQLKNDLERSFNFSFSDFSVIPALKEIDADMLLIHDRDDEEFSFDDLEDLRESSPEIDIYTTQGVGHNKLVMNRQVIAWINDYLSGV